MSNQRQMRTVVHSERRIEIREVASFDARYGQPGVCGNFVFLGQTQEVGGTYALHTWNAKLINHIIWGSKIQRRIPNISTSERGAASFLYIIIKNKLRCALFQFAYFRK